MDVSFVPRYPGGHRGSVHSRRAGGLGLGLGSHLVGIFHEMGLYGMNGARLFVDGAGDQMQLTLAHFHPHVSEGLSNVAAAWAKVLVVFEISNFSLF